MQKYGISRFLLQNFDSFFGSKHEALSSKEEAGRVKLQENVWCQNNISFFVNTSFSMCSTLQGHSGKSRNHAAHCKAIPGNSETMLHTARPFREIPKPCCTLQGISGKLRNRAPPCRALPGNSDTMFHTA